MVSEKRVNEIAKRTEQTLLDQLKKGGHNIDSRGLDFWFIVKLAILEAMESPLLDSFDKYIERMIEQG